MLFSLSSPPALAQQLPDSAFLRQNLHDELGPDSRLYNGYEYIRNGTPAKGFPFFETDSLQKAALSYDGILYRDIPLEYDLVLDKVIIRDYTGKSLISLISEKVDDFSFGTRHFRYIIAIDNPGFYEVLLSSGPITLLARREKKLNFPSNREDQARYDQRNSYYLRIGNNFYQVDGKTALLDALKDKKDALKKFISANKLHFKKQLETSLTRTTAYYTHLSH
ncbi:MAG TPA: hypothetical protein VGQ51_16315 [Puia sp.]|jgi:hypothetical protein|nr:hypothetical protein [Puia sp.]